MPAQSEIKVSFLTFTRNEERNIQGVIRNIMGIADEIVVIDSFSEDNTVKVAKQYGAKVYFAKPFGYVEPLRPYGIKKASYEWILYLDCDERLNDALRNDLKKLITEAERQRAGALIVLRKLVREGIHVKPLDTSLCRVFKKEAVSYKGIIHEHPIINGKALVLPKKYSIIHFPSPSKRKTTYLYLEKVQLSPTIPRFILKMLHVNTDIIFKLPKTLHQILIPFYFPSLFLAHTFHQLLKNNTMTLFDLEAILTQTLSSSYRSIMIALRSKKEDEIAETLQRHGALYHE